MQMKPESITIFKDSGFRVRSVLLRISGIPQPEADTAVLKLFHGQSPDLGLPQTRLHGGFPEN